MNQSLFRKIHSSLWTNEVDIKLLHWKNGAVQPIARIGQVCILLSKTQMATTIFQSLQMVYLEDGELVLKE